MHSGALAPQARAISCPQAARGSSTVLLVSAAALAGLVLVAREHGPRHAPESRADWFVPAGPPAAAVEEAPRAPAAAAAETPPAAGPRVLTVPMFKQWDPRWAGDRLGDTRTALANAGCTVSCAAMVLAHLGLDADPGKLNAWLRAHGGYTGRGWLVWEKCAEYSGGRAALDYLGEPEAAVIERALAAGRPAIVKLFLAGGAQHWVLVVGRDGEDWLVNDPLDRSEGPVRLARGDGRIAALRVFRRR
jgi:hypothetical protein